MSRRLENSSSKNCYKPQLFQRMISLICCPSSLLLTQQLQVTVSVKTLYPRKVTNKIKRFVYYLNKMFDKPITKFELVCIFIYLNKFPVKLILVYCQLYKTKYVKYFFCQNISYLKKEMSYFLNLSFESRVGHRQHILNFPSAPASTTNKSSPHRYVTPSETAGNEPAFQHYHRHLYQHAMEAICYLHATINN